MYRNMTARIWTYHHVCERKIEWWDVIRPEGSPWSSAYQATSTRPGVPWFWKLDVWPSIRFTFHRPKSCQNHSKKFQQKSSLSHFFSYFLLMMTSRQLVASRLCGNENKRWGFIISYPLSLKRISYDEILALILAGHDWSFFASVYLLQSIGAR